MLLLIMMYVSNVFDGCTERISKLEVWDFQSFYIEKEMMLLQIILCMYLNYLMRIWKD